MLKPSPIFSEYWQFAYRRQEVFRARHIKGYGTGKEAMSFFDDPIISTYKFTNCYRATDRTSQYLIRQVIYGGEFSAEDTFLRVILFKLFNKIETWEWLENQVGSICLDTFDASAFSQILNQRLSEKQKIYSAAYIMPSGVTTFGFERKHDNHLALTELMLRDGLPSRIWDFNSLQQIYALLLEYPTVGPFLAMQYAIDLAYSHYSQAEESQFIVAGPGAIRGIKKCFSSVGHYSDKDVIQYMTDNQEAFFEKYDLKFGFLTNRRLQLIDCQNLFCEFDKYCRVRFPEISVGNKRIKQKYKQHLPRFDIYLPPKWEASL